MTDDPRIARTWLGLGALAICLVLGAVMWWTFHHGLIILLVGLRPLTALRRKRLQQLLRAFEKLLARAIGDTPAASLPKSRDGPRAPR